MPSRDHLECSMIRAAEQVTQIFGDILGNHYIISIPKYNEYLTISEIAIRMKPLRRRMFVFNVIAELDSVALLVHNGPTPKSVGKAVAKASVVVELPLYDPRDIHFVFSDGQILHISSGRSE